VDVPEEKRGGEGEAEEVFPLVPVKIGTVGVGVDVGVERSGGEGEAFSGSMLCVDMERGEGEDPATFDTLLMGETVGDAESVTKPPSVVGVTFSGVGVVSNRVEEGERELLPVPPSCWSPPFCGEGLDEKLPPPTPSPPP